MAEAAVSFVIERFSDLLIQKVASLKGVRGQVERLQNELVRMRCFLKDADAKQDEDQRIRNWVSQIRAAAYDSEDVIETFIVKMESLKEKGFLLKLVYFPMQISLLNNVGKEIESIQMRISEIAGSRDKYGIKDLGEGPNTRAEELHSRRFSSPSVEDKDIVALEKKTGEIVSELLNKDEKKRRVVSIVGMGGLGKTTLARAVYNQRDVKAHFNCKVWICISQEYNYKTILVAVMKQVKEQIDLQLLEMLEKSQVHDLEEMVYKELENKCYLVVLDDIWETQVWDGCLARAFPDAVNGSRLLLTTRNRGVPLSMDPISIPYELESLDIEDSWHLLLRKVYGDSIKLKCSLELESTGREIARRCAGLPLAITVIGGFLATKKKLKSEWERVLSNINMHFSTSESQLSSIYFDLPSHLKSCFLYFGLFPEDYEIKTRKLIHLWVAQGFIQQKGTESMERIAEDHLEELISRNMVQVGRVSVDERIKSCQMHDVLRELAISKAKEENFLEIHGLGVGDVPRSAHSRYLALYSRYESFNFSKVVRPHLRSLLFFDAGSNPSSSPLGLGFKRFSLLRVADLENMNIRRLPKEVGKLFLLRYLGLRRTKIQELPRSLRFLQSLQTLDLFTIFQKVEVPNVIWKLKNLQHLFLHRIKCDVPLKVDGLENLRTLSRIDCDHLLHNNLAGLTSLSKLGVLVDGNSELDKLSMSLVKLGGLCFLGLYVSTFSGSRIPSLVSLAGLSDLHALPELKLSGNLAMLPHPNHFPSNLSRLTLAYNNLAEDPMPILEKLWRLSFLKLSVANSCTKLMISKKGFPQLKFLHLEFLFNLKEIILAHGAMPELKSLRIRCCDYLKTLPEEIKCMAGLEKLEIMDMPAGFVNRLRGEDWFKVRHVRSVSILHSETEILQSVTSKKVRKAFMAGLSR